MTVLQPMHAKPYVAISGSIASGKSTLASELGRKVMVPCLLEHPEQNAFFEDPHASVFAAQVNFLVEAVESSRAITEGGRGGIQERTPHEQASVFGVARNEQGRLSKDEFDLLSRVSESLLANVRTPDLLVFLTASPTHLLERVRSRGRSAEQDVDLAYLQLLETRYDAFLAAWNACPVLRVDTNDLAAALKNSPELRVKVVREGVVAPTRAHSGDAGLDLPAGINTSIEPLGRKAIPTGLCVEIPAGYVGLVVPRSGLAVHRGITHLDGPGIIDSGYRGEVHMLLYNTERERSFDVRLGERLGQMIVVPYAALTPVTVGTLSPGSRGDKGFGSSGMHQQQVELGEGK
jgi:dUTP pyrophosphatase